MDLPIDVVFARGEGIVGMPNGQRVHVRGGTHWPAEDPIVRMRPDLFTRDSRFGMLYTSAQEEYDPNVVAPMDDDVLEPLERRVVADEPADEPDVEDAAKRVDPDVETATANPGEKRSVRRGRRAEAVSL